MRPADELRERFAHDGYVRVPGAFDPAGMADRVWAFLGARGIDRTDRATWPAGSVHHLQKLRPAPAFAAIGSETTIRTIDALLGEARWRTPKHWGQFLVTFPTPGPWVMPHRVWHADTLYMEPVEPPFGVLVFSFLDEVREGGGGTLVLAGSHRLAPGFVASRSAIGTEPSSQSREAFFRRDPWLAELVSPDAARQSDPVARRTKFCAGTTIDGVDVRVVELTGEPGDIVLQHRLVAHCGAPNCTDTPRLMRVARPTVQFTQLTQFTPRP